MKLSANDLILKSRNRVQLLAELEVTIKEVAEIEETTNRTGATRGEYALLNTAIEHDSG